jgi:type II secretory pathway pseudopilin PulG
MTIAIIIAVGLAGLVLGAWLYRRDRRREREQRAADARYEDMLRRSREFREAHRWPPPPAWSNPARVAPVAAATIERRPEPARQPEPAYDYTSAVVAATTHEPASTPVSFGGDSGGGGSSGGYDSGSSSGGYDGGSFSGSAGGGGDW